ncbi:hypothetical protein X975_16640, partial [Stegodyphus mimosarum]
MKLCKNGKLTGYSSSQLFYRYFNIFTFILSCPSLVKCLISDQMKC